MSRTVAKAQRLHREGRVHQATQARVFIVDGDTGIYTVTVMLPQWATCSCPNESGDACSHITACLLQIQQEGRQ